MKREVPINRNICLKEALSPIDVLPRSDFSKAIQTMCRGILITNRSPWRPCRELTEVDDKRFLLPTVCCHIHIAFPIFYLLTGTYLEIAALDSDQLVESLRWGLHA